MQTSDINVRLEAGQVVNVRDFLVHITDPRTTDPLSQFLSDLMTKNRILRDSHSLYHFNAAREEAVITMLNMVIYGPSLYKSSPELFPHLSPALSKRVRTAESGVDIARLNRDLLTFYYPDYIHAIASQPSRPERTPRSLVSTWVKRLKQQWAVTLWVLLVAGALLYSFIGNDQQFWHNWEVAALATALAYNAIFYIIGFFAETQWFAGFPPRVMGSTILLMFIACALIGVATYFSLNGFDCRLQLSCVIVAMISLAAFDKLMWLNVKSQRVSDDFRSAYCFIDIPVTLAFVVMLAFVPLYLHSHTAADDHKLVKCFVGGAISFQMLVANSVLAAIFRVAGSPHLVARPGASGRRTFGVGPEVNNA